MYKYKKGLLPKSFDHVFTELGNVHKYDTRYRTNFRHEIHKINTVFNSGPKLWNTLPETIKNITSVKSFGKAISNYLRYQEV